MSAATPFLPADTLDPLRPEPYLGIALVEELDERCDAVLRHKGHAALLLLREQPPELLAGVQYWRVPRAGRGSARHGGAGRRGPQRDHQPPYLRAEVWPLALHRL